MYFFKAYFFAILFLLVALTRANTRLEIDLLGRDDNTARLRCTEHLPGGSSSVATEPSLFLFNSSGLVVTTFLETKGIETDFDPDTGILSFEIRQDVEGYYFCGKNTELAGNDFQTIIAHPDRQNVQVRYVARAGDPVRIYNGVGDGNLATHYRSQWYRNGIELEGATINRGRDFSLLLESVEPSDNGDYFSEVTIYTDENRYLIEHVVGPEILIKLIVYRTPSFERAPSSSVMVQENGGSESVSFDCIATGEPQLKVSWFKNGHENLTALAMDSSHYIIEQNKTNDGTRIESRLTVDSITHLDSGVYGCVATVLTGDEEVMAKENATLTVLDSLFDLNIVVTEDKQLQLWVELRVPLPDTVRAAVCFTSLDSGVQQHRTTSSALINSTIMIFQLEPREIPDDFQEGDFRVQVALQVGFIKGPLVPSNLEEADIANLDKPTGNDCKESDKYKIPVIMAGSVVGITLVVFVLLFCCYKTIIRVKKLNRLSASDIKDLIEKNEKLLNEIKDIYITKDSELSEEKKKDLVKQKKEMIKHTEGVINGDGASRDNNSTNVP